MAWYDDDPRLTGDDRKRLAADDEKKKRIAEAERAVIEVAERRVAAKERRLAAASVGDAQYWAADREHRRAIKDEDAAVRALREARR